MALACGVVIRPTKLALASGDAYKSQSVGTGLGLCATGLLWGYKQRLLVGKEACGVAYKSPIRALALACGVAYNSPLERWHWLAVSHVIVN